MLFEPLNQELDHGSSEYRTLHILGQSFSAASRFSAAKKLSAWWARQSQKRRQSLGGREHRVGLDGGAVRTSPIPKTMK